MIDLTRAAGIGGILRDCDSIFRIIFSKSIRTADSNLAELMVANKAFKLFSSSFWARSHKLFVGSDLIDMVKWISNPSCAPWRLRWLVHKI
ncbi:hypothetical protein PTKIN_Ptkin12aG0111100 [Pterospermum kingtungense]